MKISKCIEEHLKECKEELKIFTINLNDCIHVELCCDKCEKRYVADIYNLEEA